MSCAGITGRRRRIPATGPPSRCASIPLAAIRPVGSARFTVTTETDEHGRFSVSLGDVGDETFDVNVKPAGGLSREQRGVRLRRAASRTVRFGAVSDGDLDGNDRIDAQDAAALRAHFGRFAGEAGYTPTADFDRDGRITVLDWSHIARGQGRQGPELVP